MNTYEEYLIHRYQGGCNDLDCQWCFPPEIPEGACPPWDLLKEIQLRNYKKQRRPPDLAELYNSGPSDLRILASTPAQGARILQDHPDPDDLVPGSRDKRSHHREL